MSIKVRNLTKLYGDTRAVNDISFEVNKGEILGFLGPNGAGKTTTMKIITCFMPPTSGMVEVDGLDIFEHSIEVRKKIGYLPESNPLYHDMNVIEFLDFSAKMQGMKKSMIKSRMDEMVEVCGLKSVRHKDIGELSKGYRQRVGLAQALIHDPDVLILDEPTSGLDPNQIVEIRQLIRSIGMSKTVILSTHILSEVQATCDRVVIINKGNIVADGTLDELQGSFRGSDIINVELKAEVSDPMAEMHPLLASIEGSEKVVYQKSESDSHFFNLYSAKGTDLREKLFSMAVEQNWPILGLSRKTASLEELFRQLTTENFYQEVLTDIENENTNEEKR